MGIYLCEYFLAIFLVFFFWKKKGCGRASPHAPPGVLDPPLGGKERKGIRELEESGLTLNEL